MAVQFGGDQIKHGHTSDEVSTPGQPLVAHNRCLYGYTHGDVKQRTSSPNSLLSIVLVWFDHQQMFLGNCLQFFDLQAAAAISKKYSNKGCIQGSSLASQGP